MAGVVARGGGVPAPAKPARQNKTRAAEMLGISLKTLHNKLNRMKQAAQGA